MTKVLKLMKEEKFKYKYSGVIMAYLFLVLFMVFIGMFDDSGKPTNSFNAFKR